MSGLKEHNYDFVQAGGQVTPDEIDEYLRYNTGILSVDTAWFGTCAGGTSTQAKPLVLINANADYPRNAYYGVAGTSDMGGTWVVNGYDQFGKAFTETVAVGTATNGGTVAGTTIIGSVTSGTFTVATGSKGNGSARLGVAIGTSGTTLFKLGLLTKIGGTADVKNITWVKENVVTTVNGGTIGALVDATNHAFSGSAIMGGTEQYVVRVKPTWDNSGKPSMSGV